MPEFFNIKNNAHFNWLQGILKKIEMKLIVNEKLGIAYPIFDGIPDENKVSEQSVGLQILPASELEIISKSDADEEVEENQEEAEDDNTKKRVRKNMQTFRVVQVKNNVVYCSEEGAGQRCFHANAVLLVESGRTEMENDNE